MNISIRPARASDLEFVSQDGYAAEDAIGRRIEAGEVFVAEADAAYAGYLRLEFIWSIHPYVSLIRVLEPLRGRGIGRALLAYVEATLRDAGHTVLYSSSQADETEPQAWHRHMGFAECGIISGMNEGGIGEIFFRKQL